MAIKKIAIRFGHTILINGQNTSATGIRREYEIIREYAPLVIKYLKEQGYDVLNITPNDRSYSTEIQDINAGINKANDWGADLFVSCHANSYDLPSANGCEVLYSGGNSAMQTMATNICKELSAIGIFNRGAKADVRGLNEIRKTSMPAIICEPIFCSSPVDMKLYSADKIARAIVKGITGKSVSNTDNTNNIKEIVKEEEEIVMNDFTPEQKARQQKFIAPDNNNVVPVGNNITPLNNGGWIEVVKGRVITHLSRVTYYSLWSNGNLTLTHCGETRNL